MEAVCKRFSHTLAFVVAGTGTNRVDVPPTSANEILLEGPHLSHLLVFLLRVNFRVTIDLWREVNMRR